MGNIRSVPGVGAQGTRGSDREGHWGQGRICPGRAERFGVCCREDGEPLKDLKQVTCILKIMTLRRELITVFYSAGN